MLMTLMPGHRFLHAQRAGRIRVRAHQAAVERAGAHRHGRRGVAADFLGDIDARASADGAVDAAIRRRNRAFHHHQVLALFLFHHAIERRVRVIRRRPP